MSARLEGGCHCGALRYAVDGEVVRTVVCHCRACQRSLGAAFAVFANVAAGDFRYARGVPAVYRSTPQVRREFCGACGTQLVFRRDAAARIGVNAATLDDPQQVKPDLHIWSGSDIGWFDTTDPAPRHAQSPW
ncbi:MAG TPA: GFA family protein [Rhizomicrobium sp.]